MTRRGTSFSVLLRRRAGTPPLYRQIAEEVREAMHAGILRPGMVLPSSRALAAELGVSRNTVLQAYDELLSEGLIEGSARSAMRVCRRDPTASPVLTPAALIGGAGVPGVSVPLPSPDGTPLYVFVPVHAATGMTRNRREVQHKLSADGKDQA